MADIIEFLDRLFLHAPYYWLSWPVVAMLAGTLLSVSSTQTATRLAITPRSAGGLVGIVTAPFVHANFAHLAANVLPFIVLGALIPRRGEEEFVRVALVVLLAQGASLWLFGRRAAHMGMSGVIFGFLGWLLGVAWFTRATPDLLIAAGVLAFYGGMLAGVAPARNGTSWEGHLFGLIAGGAAAWFYLGR